MKSRKKTDNEICELKAKISNLERKNNMLKDLLSAALQAKENGCQRGQYCCGCAHAVLVDEHDKIACYCTYGQCDHFEKSKENIIYGNRVY